MINKEKLIRKHVENSMYVYKNIEKIKSACKLSKREQCRLCNSLYNLVDSSRRMLEIIVGDYESWIDWFCTVNKFGSMNILCKVGLREFQLDNVDKLIEFLSSHYAESSALGMAI